MRALVTGGAGFIGSHVVDALLARGDEVLALDDLSTGRVENLERRAPPARRWSRADVTDPAAVADAFERSRPERVFHLAAQIDVRRSVTDPRFDLDVNVGGTIDLLEASRRAGVARLRPRLDRRRDLRRGRGPALPLAEDAECLPDAALRPVEARGRGLLSASIAACYGLATASRCGSATSTARARTRTARRAWSRSSARALLEGRRPSVFGDGEQTRDYVFVADVVGRLPRRLAATAPARSTSGPGSRPSVIDARRRRIGLDRAEFDPELAAAAAGRGAADRDRPRAAPPTSSAGGRGSSSTGPARDRVDSLEMI